MQNHCRCSLIVRSVRCTSYLHQHGSNSAAAEHSAHQNATVGNIGVRVCVRACVRACLPACLRAAELANSLCYVLAWLAVQLTGLHRQLPGQYRRLLDWCRQSIGLYQQFECLYRSLTGVYRNSSTTHPKHWTYDWVRAERLELSGTVSTWRFW